MLVALSLLFLFVTVKGQTCYIGSVSEELDKATPSLGYWYLNLSSVSSCSGKLEEYEVNYYYSSNFDGNYYVHVAMWEPGENNTSYTMMSGTRERFRKEFDDKRRKRDLDSLTEGISGINIRKGTVIGVYFESGKKALPILGETNSGSHSLCKLQGSKDTDSLDCTLNKIENNLVLHAQAKIGALECNPLSNIQHGDVAYINGGDTQYGAIAQYTCNIGYELGQSGNEYRMCQSSEEWNGSQPSCQIISCGEPDNVQNGKYSGNTHTYSSIILYSCNEGYEIIGNSTAVCLANKSWNSVPTCKQVICENISLSNGHLSNQDFSYSSIVFFTCDNGYVLNGNENLLCEGSGNWNGSVPICAPATCCDPGVPENGQRHVESSVYEANTTFSSNGKNGQQNQSFSCTFGSQIEFSCFSGYELNGSSSISCQADGNWTGSLPNCSIISCEPPKQFINGIVLGNTYTYESNITFECNIGYSLQGSSSAICSSNKQWSNKIPSCLRRCSAPQATPMLFQSPYKSFYVEGDTVTFWCYQGYKLKGYSKITCFSNGQWNESIPSCELLSTDFHTIFSTSSDSVSKTNTNSPSNLTTLESIAITIVVTIFTTALALSLLSVLIIYIYVHKKRKSAETTEEIPNTIQIRERSNIEIYHNPAYDTVGTYTTVNENDYMTVNENDYVKM